MLTNRSLNSTLDRMLTLNRALDQAFNSAWTDNRVWVPAIDVVEKKDAYLLYAELPGVDASHVDISFEQNILTIRGTKHSSFDAAKQGELRVYAAERVNGSFERSTSSSTRSVAYSVSSAPFARAKPPSTIPPTRCRSSGAGPSEGRKTRAISNSAIASLPAFTFR